MVHTERPLQEKMALFWHNHFATGYTKIAGVARRDRGARATWRRSRRKIPGSVRGQLELFRDYALGNFRDLLVAVARDVAMLVWLDGRTNIKARPQENFARELMELFTMGVGHVRRDRRLRRRPRLHRLEPRAPARGDGRSYQFIYNAAQHDTAAKTFTFPILRRREPDDPGARGRAGMQDGLDLIAAVARHPATGPRLARKLYAFFVSEVGGARPGADRRISRAPTTRTTTSMKAVLRKLLLSPQFVDADNRFARYSWPVEFVVRALKEIGWTGFSVNDALTPLSNMGQQLFEPPDVAGWELGPGWFSTGSMLARMNFAAQLATNQKFNLRDCGARQRQDPGGAVVAAPRPAHAAALRPTTPIARCSTTGAPARRGPARTRKWPPRPPGSCTSSSASGDYQLV